MSLGRYVLLALLLLPAAEIAAFYAVASAIGFLRALALFLATSLVGLAILRGGGLARIIELGRAGGERAATIQAQAASLVVLVAGALLLVPGFVSDLIGLGLLLAPRVWSRALLRRVLRPNRPPGNRDDVVDLEPMDWQRVPDKRLQHRRDRDPRP